MCIFQGLLSQKKPENDDGDDNNNVDESCRRRLDEADVFGDEDAFTPAQVTDIPYHLIIFEHT